MKKYINKDNIEAGVDECARGVLFGRIYGATVIYPKEGINDPLESLKHLPSTNICVGLIFNLSKLS